LPLTRHSQIQVLVTPRGLMLLPPVATPVTPPPAAQPAGLPPLPSATSSSGAILQALLSGTNAAPTKGALLVEQMPSGPLKLPASGSPVPPQIAAPFPKTLLAAATSQVLPIAQPLKALLNVADITQRLIAGAPSQPTGSPLVELGALLNKMSSLAIDVTAVKPDTL